MKTKRLITRRRAIIAGAASIGGLIFTRFPKDLPPTYGNLLRMGDSFTYAAHRVLLPRNSLAKEYLEADITSFPAVGTTNPGVSVKSEHGDEYRRLDGGEFSDWRLSVEGSVANPRAFSLEELRQLPARTQITRHTCEEGWTAICKWTGVPLSQVLQAVGMLPSARFVVFYAYDGWVNSIDLIDAFHPQTILAYGLNGQNLPTQHGAPLRLRVERHVGYKSMKYLRRIVITDEFEDGGEDGMIQKGWAWYTGI